MTFISIAHAQTAIPQGTTEFLNTLLMFGLIFLVFYFLVIRPQQKKLKQHREMLTALRRGDRIVTSGGIISLVTKVVNDQEVVVEIADNVRVRVVRETIARVIAKTEPARIEPVGDKTTGEDTSPALGNADAQGGEATGEGSAAGLKKLLGSRSK